ncbi:WD repeat-containing protein CG11141 [Cylas formicarius]|uniref:WD repeat-containing protein CG11141 n=1 Tax=Cylas formicarius TaxID=197179 RepID=UPI0029586BD4|nr:WD repeat-containing protein CG11141 [Cylas formicarius]
MKKSEYHPPGKTLKEWAPLTELFNLLPTKTNGIFSKDITLTSIDVLPEFLALGTNVGIVYWFDRNLKKLQKLYCEDLNPCITCVKIISTVDYMVACGNESGAVTIFQVPQSHPKSLPESLKPKDKQIERYTVCDLHKSRLTALEWSKNGMKLFSGDDNGLIVLTEIDFYMHVCKSSEILNETYKIVQLSYCQQRLLISTTFRSILCHKSDKWVVTQVGKRDRKTLGEFGGVMHRYGYKPTDINVYCIRPGLRVWVSDFDGNVQKTLLFKDPLTKEWPTVELLNPSRSKPHIEPSFGKVAVFCGRFLVTYGADVIYILDPEKMTLISTVSRLRGALDVAVSEDEIFILEGDRSLIRVSFRPDGGADERTFGAPQSKEVIRAEEAVESQSVSNKFDGIGSKEFEDAIRFKRVKKVKAVTKDVMSDSATSLSSDERDASYVTPTIMNLSTVGVLPDLRSPESIINDIEYKEKILSDILNLDKISLPTNPPERKDEVSEASNVLETKTPEVTRSVGKTRVANTNYFTSTEDGLTGGTDGQNGLEQQRLNAPVVNIPFEWNLQNLRLIQSDDAKTRKASSGSGDTLSDWEIV